MSFGGSGFSFGGGANTNTNTSAGGSQSGGLFGQSNQQQPSGGLFGSTTTPAAAPPKPAGGLFGQAPSAQPQQASGGLFGSTSTAQPQQQQQQQQPSGGLFGNTQQQNTQPQGGLFGSTTQSTTGGGLFGGTSNNNSNTQSGGLFGQPAPSTNTGGLFGSTNTNTQQPAQTGGLFGQKPANSLFGSTQQQPQQQQQGGLFGSSTAPSGGLFGQSQQQPQQQSLFGQSQQQQQPQQPQQSTLSQSVGKPPETNKDIGAVIEDIKNSWDVTHPACKFQFFFYNLVPPEQVNQYGRPASVSEAAWTRACQENPDQSRLVPAPAFGFDDVQKRVHAQGRQATAHLVRLSELQEKLRKMMLNTSLSHHPRLQRAAQMHAQISARILRIVKHLHVLLPTVRASSVRADEEKLAVEYENINNTVQKARIAGRVNELWALVGALKSRKEEGAASVTGSWTVVDQDGMNELQDILRNQQTGLSHLTSTLQKVESDLNVVRSGFGLENLSI
ncbi:hypothetical protein E3Q02_01902 [Wallemia mellicola]|uniref:Nucleoporin Nup54 alpha-helical domain-containing protein n=1 Tax=Wallemia mellicola TaxID=1708541 RepID=A0AB38MWY2_9BASI|nr:hypothetical protein E3Q02_01902 [Wallemia mellicola]